MYKQLLSPKCKCCNYRYATKEYSNGSYCTQCASDQPNKGRLLSGYVVMQQLTVSSSNDNIIINNYNAITGQQHWTI